MKTEQYYLMTQEQYSLGKILPPSTITFFTDNGTTDVMKITKEGIWVNPNLTVDKAATAVIEVLDGHIKALVKRKPLSDEEIEKIIFNWDDVDEEMDLVEFARAIEAAHGIK